jgi:hypothetical protein
VTGPARLRPPAFAASSDPARLLASVADALNALENAGITVDLAGGAVMTPPGLRDGSRG